MKIRWQFLLILALIPPIYSQECAYRTLVGPPRTFVGDAVPVAEALFHNAAAIVAAADGTLHIADTGNHRVRRVDPSGIIRTVAGTGEEGFSGDGGPARQAALRRPAGVALAPDGTLYIADTGNHLIRRVTADGVISTIAGDGYPRLTFESGPARSVSLREPSGLAFDGTGRLYLNDNGNRRIRRLDPDGTLRTIAGANPMFDYPLPDAFIVPEGTPAIDAVNLKPNSLGVTAAGQLYIGTPSGILTVDAEGRLRTWLAADAANGAAPAGPVPLAELKIYPQGFSVAPDGAVFVFTLNQTIGVRNGIAQLFAAYGVIGASAHDPSTGGVVTLDDYTLARTPPDRAPAQVLWRSPLLLVNPSAAEAGLDVKAIAIAPDGTAYLALPGRIVARRPDGRIEPIAGRTNGSFAAGTLATEAGLGTVGSLAIDSRGLLHFAEPGFQRIRKIDAEGRIRDVATTFTFRSQIRFDAQDRLYVLRPTGELTRISPDGTRASVGFLPGQIITELSQGTYDLLPLTTAADGTTYVGLPVPQLLAGAKSTILKLPPSQSASNAAMDDPASVFALAVAADGGLYFTTRNGIVRKLQPDGRSVTIRNRDRRGFWGEFGADSQPRPLSPPADLALDATAGLWVVDSSATYAALTAVRRIDLASCHPEPGPMLRAAVDAAAGNTDLLLAPGMLFSLYGARLGPTTPALGPVTADQPLPIEIDGTQVLINGIPSPLLFVSAGQVNAIVPFALDGQAEVRLEIVRQDLRSDVLLARTGRVGPAVFGFPAAGRLSPAHLIHQDGTINGPDHPARPGDILLLYATGLGLTNPAGEDGRLAGTILKRAATPLALTLGDRPAEILYAGTAPGMVEGVSQVNFRVPAGPNGSTTLYFGGAGQKPNGGVRLYLAH